MHKLTSLINRVSYIQVMLWNDKSYSYSHTITPAMPTAWNAQPFFMWKASSAIISSFTRKYLQKPPCPS